MPNASLRILQPEATTNYILNPSIRYDVTGWNAFGSTIARTLARARFGISSLSVITNGAVLNEGTFFRVSSLSGIQDFVTVSVYVRGAGKVCIRLIDNPRGAQWASQPVALTDTRWMRLEVTGRCTGSNDMRLYVETAENTAKAITFYVDGAQMELKPYSTTYADGDQPDCRWNLTAHSTLSTRDASSRKGGRWVALAGSCRSDDDIYLTVVGGLGMPPISNNTQPFAVAPGGYFQNTKVNSRVITLTFNTKNPSLQITRNPSLRKLHELRQQLIDIIKPDKGNDDDGFIFEYTDGPVPIYFSARYDAGLDGQWDVRNQWVNTFPIRLLSVSPMLWEDDQEVKQLNFRKSQSFFTVAGRISQQWNRMNYATNGNASTLVIGKKGELYLAGTFTVVNNNALAVNPFVSALRIAVWGGTSWSSLGVGADNTIEAIAISPDGKIYVTGLFLNIGGIAANRIAYWDPVTSTWNAMGTGLNAGGLSLAVAPNGTVYVGGSFTTAGGGTARQAAFWNGAWHSMGTSAGFDAGGTVNTLAISKDGTRVYLGGAFTSNFGGAANLLRVCSYDPSTSLFSAMGSGFDGTVTSLIVSPLSGILYAAGSFVLSGTATMNYIAKWNGSAWVAMGSGMNAAIGDIDVDSNENVIAAGAFTLAGGISSPQLSLWNGSVWVNTDVVINSGGTPSFAAVRFHPNGDIFLGGGSFSVNQSTFASINTVTNSGSANTSPSIYILGPGRLRWIENQTTKKRVYMDLTVLSTEEITINFGAAQITSSVRGDVSYSILPGSDFKSFSLSPGDNTVACFMTDDVQAQMWISYIPQHWSIDATARGDELF